jgi:murein DD-endopeptidase MepM/ murein hydrolase activator NlpD
MTTEAFTPVLNPMILREDKGGSGRYGSGRIGHTHQGMDFVCRPGQEVYAPFAGRIVRSAQPYANDARWEGLVLQSRDGDYECKLFYCTLIEDVGAYVQRGQLVAVAQGISKKYSSGVTDHVHVELRQGGKVLNPEHYWRWTASTIA